MELLIKSINVFPRSFTVIGSRRSSREICQNDVFSLSVALSSSVNVCNSQSHSLFVIPSAFFLVSLVSSVIAAYTDFMHSHTLVSDTSKMIVCRFSIVAIYTFYTLTKHEALYMTRPRPTPDQTIHLFLHTVRQS